MYKPIPSDSRLSIFARHLSAVFPGDILKKIKQKVLRSVHNNLCYGGFYTTPYAAARGGKKKCAVQLAETGAEATEANGFNRNLGFYAKYSRRRILFFLQGNAARMSNRAA